MTVRDLDRFYDKKMALINSEQTLEGLREYLSALVTADPNNPSIGSIQGSIDQLAAVNTDTRKGLEEEGEIIKMELSVVEDDAARIGSMLHYYEGLSWETVAGILKCSKHAIAVRSRRHLNRSGIK